MGAISLGTRGVLCFGNTVRIIPVEKINLDLGLQSPMIKIDVDDIRFDVTVRDVEIDLEVMDI